MVAAKRVGSNWDGSIKEVCVREGCSYRSTDLRWHGRPVWKWGWGREGGVGVYGRRMAAKLFCMAVE